MPYFTISAGLRGAYMPDSCYVMRAQTRRELKSAIESEARDYREAGFVGANKRAIAWLAATMWREAQKARPAYLPHCLELAPSHARDNYCHGIFVSTATRAEYLESMAQEDCF
jgi:hypothetical protein